METEHKDENVAMPQAEKDLYGELRNAINLGRDDFRKQLATVKEAIAARQQELELLEIKKSKLEGAIEASEIYLKAVLPSGNK